jgi:hypothetical protein
VSHTCSTTIHVSMRPGGCQQALDCTGVRVTRFHCMYADTRDAALYSRSHSIPHPLPARHLTSASVVTAQHTWITSHHSVHAVEQSKPCQQTTPYTQQHLRGTTSLATSILSTRRCTACARSLASHRALGAAKMLWKVPPLLNKQTTLATAATWDARHPTLHWCCSSRATHHHERLTLLQHTATQSFMTQTHCKSAHCQQRTQRTTGS